MFELNFRDERYLLFEGCGAISGWKLELSKEVRQFDYNTIADIVLHIQYTAQDGGDSLRNVAESGLKIKLNEIKQILNETGLHVAVNMKNDLPNEWNLLKKNGKVNLTIDKSRLPYFVQSVAAENLIENVIFIAEIKDEESSDFSIKIGETLTNLSKVDSLNLYKGDIDTINLDTIFELSINQTLSDNLEELILVVKYGFEDFNG